MDILLRVWGLLTTIPNRLLSQWALVLAAIFGLVSSISLILSIPLYADSIYYQTLQRNIYNPDDEGPTTRSPFTYLFHYYGGEHDPVQWEDIQDIDQYYRESVVDELGLPLILSVRYISSVFFPFFASETSSPKEASSYDEDHILEYVNLSFMDGLQDHIEIVEGRFPAPASVDQDDPIEILVAEELAIDLGLQVGEEYLAFIQSETQTGTEVTTQIPLRIGGIWRPLDPDELYWVSVQDAYYRKFFVPEESFRDRISPVLPNEVYSAYWYFVMDGSDIHVEDVNRLLVNIRTVEKYSDILLPNIRLSVSPKEALWDYRQASLSLTILLYAFSVPILGLILAFIGMVSRLSVERQRNEIAILRSRGASPIQILSLIALEGLVLGLISLAISLPVTVQLTKLIAKTRGFLDLAEGSQGLRVEINTSSLQIGLVAIGLVLLAMIIPALGAARHTIISYKQEAGRVTSAPWWQRTWMDVLLFIPAAYGTYMLKQQGSIALLGVKNATGTNDPFQNPLLFLVPALGVFALTLFSLRFIHPLMSLVARIAGWTKNASLTLATRQLSRSPGTYHTPLIILILTVSLSFYTTSLAQTLDEHLVDQAYYQVGADIQFVDFGSLSLSSNIYGQSGGVAQETTWYFIPVDEYRKIDGIAGVARLGRYVASGLPRTGETSRGSFIGVDRVDFPGVAFWRSDFSNQSLGALMNALAIEQDGVLVDQRILDLSSYKIGDTISPVITLYDNRLPIDLKIVGTFDYFPTWYPEQGPLIVGNLDYLFQQMGGEFPYRVLLKTQEEIDPRILGERESGINSFLSWSTPLDTISEEKGKPERQGLLGFLFIGFVTAILLTVMAFLLHMVFSFERRFIELGVLRAAGLSIGQMTGYLVWELTFLILIGGIVGTILGYFASVIFIPFMQIGTEKIDLTPPFKVIIAWDSIYQIYWMFGILFLLTSVISIILLRRMRIFQAIKLGETI